MNNTANSKPKRDWKFKILTAGFGLVLGAAFAGIIAGLFFIADFVS